MTTPAFAPPTPRLLEAARERMSHDGTPAAPDVRIIAAVTTGDPGSQLVGVVPGMRIVMLDWIGTHPDAEDAALKASWELEEAARATGADVVALRLAPLVGPGSPLMAWLARRPGLDARSRRRPLQPVLETDAVATIARAWSGEGPREGAFEICGKDVVDLGELLDLAVAQGTAAFTAAPECEPSLAILRGQGLSEWEPWAVAFGIMPSPIDLGLAHEAHR